jgi:hypothetical protein
MILIFNRKVIPINEKEARVETDVVGFIDSAAYEIGRLCFPSKQSWTKFWGAVQRGALALPDLETKLQNVPPGEGEIALPQRIVDEEMLKSPEAQKKWVGNQLVEVDK